MIFAEYDYDTDIRVQRREAFEDGLTTGIAQGVIEGERRGKEEGRTIEKLAIAKSFLNAGLDINIIAKCTGLSVDELMKLNT